MWDPHLKDGCAVTVLETGALSPSERKYIGATGRISRAYVASCRVEINGSVVMLPKSALKLITKR